MVAVGGMLSVFAARASSRRATWLAGSAAVVVFVLGHVPHDLVMPETATLERYAGLIALGSLLTAIYLRTGNAALIATLHALLNQPLLLADPGGVRPLIWTIHYAACIAVLVWYPRER